jgi:hypothetical protein
MKSWLHSNAQIIGKSHIKNNLPCQDYSNTYQDVNFNIVVLSDGCGSSKHSEIGSKIVVEQTIQLMKNDFDYIITLDPIEGRKYILNQINMHLKEKADALDVDVKELNATLLFVVVKDNENLLLGHLGDGFIGSVNQGVLEIKSLEKKDDEVNGTFYTTTPNAFQQFDLRKGKLNDYQGFILMSDGSGDALIDSRVPFQKKFINSVAGILEYTSSNQKESTSKMLDQYLLKVRDHIQSGDDCSISMMILEQTKISTIETYHIPKPIINQKAPIYQFNSDYDQLYLYVSKKHESFSKKPLDKIYISGLLDSIFKDSQKPQVEVKEFVLDLIELQLKHLIYDGYLYEYK